MKINEDLSILFWIWKQKTSKDGLAPIYVRITVNGQSDGFSSGRKILPEHWDSKEGPSKDCADYQAILYDENEGRLQLTSRCEAAADFHFTAKGPYSSTEKKRSFSPRVANIFLIWANFGRKPGSGLVSSSRDL